jgi:hypothetical protein
MSWTNVTTGTLPVRIGAVAVATLAGALVAGLLVQLMSKGMTRQAAPRPAVNLVRLGGAVAAGLGAFLYLFPGGGYGPGQGPGGDGPGGTERTSHNDSKERDGKSTEKKKSDSTEAPRDKVLTELRVEILSDKVLGADDATNNRNYRVNTAGGPEMMSRKKVVRFIADLSTPPAVVYVVDYEDATDTDRIGIIKDLRELAGDLKKNPDQWVKAAPEPHPSPRP